DGRGTGISCQNLSQRRDRSLRQVFGAQRETKFTVRALLVKTFHVDGTKTQLFVVVAESNFYQHDVVLREKATELLEGRGSSRRCARRDSRPLRRGGDRRCRSRASLVQSRV